MPRGKRGRPKGSLEPKTVAIREAALKLMDEQEQMTVRGVFYALVLWQYRRAQNVPVMATG